MTACSQCGSIRLRVISGNPLQWVLALLLNQQVVVCGRCGFKGRQRKVRGAARSSRARGASAPPSHGNTSIDLDAVDRALGGDDSTSRPPKGKTD